MAACQVDAGYGIYLLTGEYFTVSNSEGKTKNCLEQHKIFSRFNSQNSYFPLFRTFRRFRIDSKADFNAFGGNRQTL